LALTSIIACSLAARGFKFQSRTIQTQAVCSSDYSWADNSLKQSPCLVAAYVNAPCNQGNWFIPALNYTSHYAPPSSSDGTLSPCTCSWASYNLISACTDCQGFSNVTTSWLAYTYNCAGLLSTTTYYPANITLQDTPIPFWATTNPTTWTGSQFDKTEAQNISNEGHSDVGSPTSSTNTTQSIPIGAIVGGVVGGIVLLLGAIILGICLFRRRNSRSKNVTDPSPLLMNQTHSRSQSDNNNGYTGYTSLSSSPMHRLSSPTIRTHLTRASTSIHSFPFFSSGGSTVSQSMLQQSPPPVDMQRDETAVEPFRLAPTNNYNPDRKQAQGAYPVYDPPTASPTVRMEVQPTTQTPRGRTKYNPPAYTEPTNTSPDSGGSSSSPRSPPTAHGKKGSADTLNSSTSGGNPARINVINQLAPFRTVNPHGASANTSLNVLTGHGHQLSGDTNSDMDRKRRPDTEDNFSARDIA